MYEEIISSLAILKVNSDRGNDYIDNFIPFVAESLRKAPQPEVSLSELQDAIAVDFRLRVPQGALKTILKRAAKRGYVQRTEGIYRRNDNALATLNIASTKSSVLRQHQALIHKLVEFSRNRHKITWSQEEAEAALFAYLSEHSAPILAASVEGETIPEVAQPINGAEFITGTFIADLCDSDPEGFSFLETLVKGSMLANVLFFEDLGGVGQRFDRTAIYFDTTLLLRALGLSGPSLRAPCRELLQLLYELNGDLRCFKHTFDEMQRILDAAAHALRNPATRKYGYFETFEYFIKSGHTASDVELIIASLEEKLWKLRVHVEPKPPYEMPLGLDEAKFENVLQNHVGYQREDARDTDLNSLTAIHRLRRGEFPLHIEKCNAIFVTTNHALVRASAHFFNEEYGNVPVPYCLLDHHLTTIVWLKKPMRAPDLPRKILIADCYAAMNPNDTLWRLYLQEMGRLQQRNDISENDYYLLRFSTEARNILMEITLGEPDAFTEGTVREVLERAQAEVRAETETALQLESARRQEAEQRVTTAEVRRQALLERFEHLGVSGGFWISRIILFLCVIPIIVATYLTLPEPFPDLRAGWWRFVTPLLLLSIAIFSIANLVFGTSLMSLVRPLEVKVARAIEKFLIGVFEQ